MRYLLSNVAHFVNDFQILTDLDISEDEVDVSRPGFPRHKFLPKSAYQVSHCNFDLLNKISLLFLVISICWAPVLIFTQPRYTKAKLLTSYQLVARYALFLEHISLITMLVANFVIDKLLISFL